MGFPFPPHRICVPLAFPGLAGQAAAAAAAGATSQSTSSSSELALGAGAVALCPGAVVYSPVPAFWHGNSITQPWRRWKMPLRGHSGKAGAGFGVRNVEVFGYLHWDERSFKVLSNPNHSMVFCLGSAPKSILLSRNFNSTEQQLWTVTFSFFSARSGSYWNNQCVHRDTLASKPFHRKVGNGSWNSDLENRQQSFGAGQPLEPWVWLAEGIDPCWECSMGRAKTFV